MSNDDFLLAQGRPEEYPYHIRFPRTALLIFDDISIGEIFRDEELIDRYLIIEAGYAGTLFFRGPDALIATGLQSVLMKIRRWAAEHHIQLKEGLVCDQTAT